MTKAIQSLSLTHRLFGVLETYYEEDTANIQLIQDYTLRTNNSFIRLIKLDKGLLDDLLSLKSTTS